MKTSTSSKKGGEKNVEESRPARARASRAIWSGSVSFGLVNIPVRLYSAVEERALKFHYLHAKDRSPVRFAKICRHEEREVPFSEIVRGYEHSKGQYVVLSAEDFVRANPKKTNTIEIQDFCKAEQVQPLYFEKPYYLEPDRNADKAYLLLREALSKSGKVGIAKFVLRSRENLAVVQPEGDFLVLYQLRFSDEIRETSNLATPNAKTPNPREMQMALTLIDQLTKKFNPEDYHDTYTQELERVIAEKLEGKVVPFKKPKAARQDVDDLMSLLKASLGNKPKKASKKKSA